MHHIFRIDEIIVPIVHSISANKEPFSRYTIPSWENILSQDAKSALLALALSCKTLFEPAIDRLWHTQTSLVPLLKCLTDAIKERDICEDERDESFPMHRMLCQARAFRPSDLYLFRRNARRIRILDVSIVNRDKVPLGIDPALLQSLSRMEVPILPNARRIRWQLHGLNESALSCLPLLLGSLVTDVDISMQKHSAPVLSSLRLKCPAIKKLSVRGSDPCILAFGTFKELIHHSKHLRELTYSTSNTQEIWRLFSLLSAVPHLTSLQLNIFNNLENELLPSPSHVMIFPSLRILDVSFPSRLQLDELFSSSLFPRLTTINVSVMSPEVISADCVGSLCRAIAGACSSDSLEMLTISTLERWNGLREDYRIVQPCHLHPLLSLRKLTHLSLSPSWLYSLDRRFYVDAFAALPDLLYIDFGDQERRRVCRSTLPKNLKP